MAQEESTGERNPWLQQPGKSLSWVRLIEAAANERTAWRCQVCQLDCQGPEFFRHQFSNCHLTEVHQQLQAFSAQMLSFGGFIPMQ